jgi:hypothetical protein
MAHSDITALPHCRDDPPWTDCGDPISPDFGSVFAWPAALGGVALSFDRAGLRPALTLFDAGQLGEEIALYGRRFTVRQMGRASPAP